MTLAPNTHIYLNPDGVLLDKHVRPVQCLHEFLAHITTHHQCTWLTSHVIDDNTNHVLKHLKNNGVPEETLALAAKINGTTWKFLRTDAINFDEPFLWFEDMPTSGELQVLEEHQAKENLIWVDRVSGTSLCEWLKTNG